MIVFASPFLRINAWRSLWPSRELERRGVPSIFVGKDGSHDDVKIDGRTVMIIHATNQDVGLSGVVRYFKGFARSVWVQFDDCYRWLGDVQALGGKTTPWSTMDDQWRWHERDGRAEFARGRTTIGAGWYSMLMADQAQACREAAGVICSTDAVAEGYAKWIGGRSVVIRNWLPRWITEVPADRIRGRFDGLRRHDANDPIAGWFGHLGAHRRDIRLLASAGELSPFGVVGDHADFASETGWNLAWTHDIEDDQRALYRAIGRLSVGVAPLVDDAFNRCKSWIKPLEFGALGIPTVASDVRPYRELFEDGFPVVLTKDPESMQGVARGMLDGPTVAHGDDLRAEVRDRYTLEGRGGDEWEAWAGSVL